MTIDGFAAAASANSKGEENHIEKDLLEFVSKIGGFSLEHVFTKKLSNTDVNRNRLMMPEQPIFKKMIMAKSIEVRLFAPPKTDHYFTLELAQSGKKKNYVLKNWKEVVSDKNLVMDMGIQMWKFETLEEGRLYLLLVCEDEIAHAGGNAESANTSN